MERFAANIGPISNGTVSAVLVLERFGSAAQGDPVYRAAKVLGRLFPVHGCLLGRFSGPDYRPSHAITSHFLGRLPVKTDRGQLIAEEPAVCEVFVDSIDPRAPNAGDGVSSEKDTWLDRNMLRTIVGRDLLMIAGSEEAYFLFQELFGYARTRSFGCEDNLGNSSRWPKLRHPEACIDVRVRAFFLANLLWNCFRSTDTLPHIGNEAAMPRHFRSQNSFALGLLAAFQFIR